MKRYPDTEDDGENDRTKGICPQESAHKVPAIYGHIGLLHRSGCLNTPVCCVPRTARRRWCLRIATTPEVPFCAVPTTATVVVLERRSVLGGVRVIADFLCAGIHRHSQALRSSASAMCAE